MYSENQAKDFSKDLQIVQESFSICQKPFSNFLKMPENH